jgi:hypothetical protein
MSFDTGENPIALVVVTANKLAASSTFYSALFAWQIQPFSAELAGVVALRRRTSPLCGRESVDVEARV